MSWGDGRKGESGFYPRDNRGELIAGNKRGMETHLEAESAVACVRVLSPLRCSDRGFRSSNAAHSPYRGPQKRWSDTQ